MEVKQIYEILNTITSEVLGKSDLVQEDLSNIVDVGKEIINADKVDSYVNKLVHHIGKVEFNNQKYKGKAPSVLMNKWEYGSILQRVDSELPVAYENLTWNLVDGTSYDPNIFYQPIVNSKFFDNKVTFEVPISFAERQVKGSFSNATQMNGFLSMITTSVENSLTIKLDELIIRTINNYIGNVMLENNPNTSINLLEEFNNKYNENLTTDKALTNADFLRFANFLINTYIDRITRISTLFNIGDKERFTNRENANLILLTDFIHSSNVFLQADVRHNEYTGLKNFDSVPYWQGCGTNYTFDDISSINVIVNDGSDTPKEVTQTGIIGVLFDKRALGVTNLDRRVTTNYNPKAEFYTNFYKVDCGYFNDFNQNFIVFYIEDEDNDEGNDEDNDEGNDVE
jgi:hypothetical protein